MENTVFAWDRGCGFCKKRTTVLASFPGPAQLSCGLVPRPRPAFPYCKRRKAGRSLGTRIHCAAFNMALPLQKQLPNFHCNEYHLDSLYSISTLCHKNNSPACGLGRQQWKFLCSTCFVYAALLDWQHPLTSEEESFSGDLWIQGHLMEKWVSITNYDAEADWSCN